jgi:hypothetical protein
MESQDWRTGNTFAKREKTGLTTSLYLSAEEIQILEERIRSSGIDPTKKMVMAEARGLLREAIAERGQAVKKKKSGRARKEKEEHAA